MTAQADSATSPSAKSVLAQRRALRQELKRRRRSLPPDRQRQAAHQLAILFDRHHLLCPGKRIAVYLAMPGELSLTQLIARARQRGCQLFVPHIINTRRAAMMFVPLPKDARLTRHPWGVPQLKPVAGVRHPVTIRQLDLMLIPVVGFDPYGNRLGMGAGFYDRQLATLRRHEWHRPRLIGIAHSIQRVTTIPALPHDVAIPEFMTEQALLRTRPRS